MSSISTTTTSTTSASRSKTASTGRWSKVGWTILTYLLVLILVFPVLWMVLTGFKSEIVAISIPPPLFFQPTLEQFGLAISGGFGAYLFNSAVASMRPRGANDMLFFVLSTRFMPFAAILVPLYVIITKLNLLDNLFTLIIVYTAMNLPLIIWMARSYFLDLPKEVLEGAWLDGCTTLQTIVRIVVPMAAPGLAAAALLSIIFAWNDFFFAVTLTYTNSPTLPIMVAAFTSNEGLFLAKVSALATLIIIVPVAIGVYAQQHLVRGLTGGALK